MTGAFWLKSALRVTSRVREKQPQLMQGCYPPPDVKQKARPKMFCAPPPAPPFGRTILPSHMPSKGYYESIPQSLTLSKLRSIKLIEDVPFQNMPLFHPDEEVSKENEFGPLLNDDICMTAAIHLSN